MIEQFKDFETRDSGIMYNSTLDQIKMLHAMDPAKAGELAIIRNPPNPHIITINTNKNYPIFYGKFTEQNKKNKLFNYIQTS